MATAWLYACEKNLGVNDTELELASHVCRGNLANTASNGDCGIYGISVAMVMAQVWE